MGNVCRSLSTIANGRGLIIVVGKRETGSEGTGIADNINIFAQGIVDYIIVFAHCNVDDIGKHFCSSTVLFYFYCLKNCETLVADPKGKNLKSDRAPKFCQLGSRSYLDIKLQTNKMSLFFHKP